MIAGKDAVSPNDFSLELGEFFYQLRAALDGAVYQATVIEHGSDPPPDENRIEFPLYPSPDKFNNSAANKGPLPNDFKSWFQSIQPYTVGKPPYAGDTLLAYRLKTLHDCARKDRHRRLHVLAVVPTEVNWEFEGLGDVVITSIHPLPANFLEDECEFLRFQTSAPPPKGVKLKTDISVEIGVAEIPGVVGNRLFEELAAILNSVGHAVNQFEQWYS